MDWPSAGAESLTRRPLCALTNVCNGSITDTEQPPPKFQLLRFPDSPARQTTWPPPSSLSSVSARSRWGQPVDPHGPAAGSGRPSPAEFGMGSVGGRGSVAQAKTCFRSSACSHRTRGSVVLPVPMSTHSLVGPSQLTSVGCRSFPGFLRVRRSSPTRRWIRALVGVRDPSR